ncbi:hypothetical protein TNIN_433151 [Trichonephila inaurata madagascariensis]|uniref:Uncharacterized protein n=1 Tax=Trichonephila inaurata madagascariensis TaxID=2747483 RepID=A0A8X6YKJ6_9ARAC|nr:hypothetical protein TNIN_433151 [Trichonephila inaurata madagascariensis]
MKVLPTKHWGRHGPSKENPADIASRGDVLLSVPEEIPSTFQPQRSLSLSLGVATEYQTWLLEEVELRLSIFLTASQEMAGRTTKLEERGHCIDQRGGSSWYIANCSSSSSASRQRRTGSSCYCENPRFSSQTTYS